MFSLERWLGRSREPVLGIDIGASAIHLVELAAPGWPLQVRHVASEPLPAGTLRDACIAQPEAAAEALQRALRSSGTRLRDAALALPSGAVMKKRVSLPDLLHEDDLEAEVDAEAAAGLPFPREEIGIDYAVLGPSAGQPGYVDVMLVAARRERIDERVDLATAAGLRPRIVGLESEALMAVICLAEAARSGGGQLLVAALQVDAERSRCLFALGDELLFERELGPGLSRRDADLCEQVCQEFTRAVQLFCASTNHPQPARVYLLGQLPPALPSVLHRSTRVDVVVPDPLLDMTGGLERIAPHLQARSTACLLACGLALRGFDR